MQFEKKTVFVCRYATNTETNCLDVRRYLGNEPDNNPLLFGAVPWKTSCFLLFGEKPEWLLLVLLQAPDASNRMIHAQQRRRYYNDLDIKMRSGIFVLENEKNTYKKIKWRCTRRNAWIFHAAACFLCSITRPPITTPTFLQRIINL